MIPLPQIKDELVAGSAADQRCPHLSIAPGSCTCKSPGLEAPTYNPDPLNLQLFCLAGPERWPFCVDWPEEETPDEPITVRE